jgi:hypothetical protein
MCFPSNLGIESYKDFIKIHIHDDIFFESIYNVSHDDKDCTIKKLCNIHNSVHIQIRDYTLEGKENLVEMYYNDFIIRHANHITLASEILMEDLVLVRIDDLLEKYIYDVC